MNKVKFLMEHFGLTKRPNPTYKQYFSFGQLNALLISYDKTINPVSTAELKTDEDKPTFEEWVIDLNKQRLIDIVDNETTKLTDWYELLQKYKKVKHKL